MVQEVLFYFSYIIAIAAVLAVLSRIIRQPPIIAYLITGVLAGPLFLNLIGPASETGETISIFAHIGVVFLLFIVGLSLDFRVLKEVSGVASLAGISSIIITGAIGVLISIWLGFETTSALYLGAALAFSSTVVVVKILSDKREIETLHGKIAIGILIIEDFVAAIALMIIPLIKNGWSTQILLKEILIIILLIVGIMLVTTFVLNRFMNYLARNQEAMFLFGIAWALVLATLFSKLGFSLEIGALIAGMSLASSKYTLELGGKMKPLRDFFVVLFFVFFGSQLVAPITSGIIKSAIIFSLFIIIGKPIIVMSALKLFGYKKRTNFLAASSLAQISEFSLILVLLGYTLGYLSREIMSIAILIAIITIGVSSYSIYYSHRIFDKISRFLNIFDGTKLEVKNVKDESYDIILFGYHRIGHKIANKLFKRSKKVLIVDYNPKVVLVLLKQKANALYGDASDKYFLNELPLDKAKLIISTIPEEQANLFIREALKESKSGAIFIATAEQPRIALDLYQKGVDFVLIPHHVGGDYASEKIDNYWLDKQKYRKDGENHYKELKKSKDSSKFI